MRSNLSSISAVEALRSGWQVIIETRAKPIPKKPCYSEYYLEPKSTPQIYRKINIESNAKIEKPSAHI